VASDEAGDVALDDPLLLPADDPSLLPTDEAGLVALDDPLLPTDDAGDVALEEPPLLPLLAGEVALDEPPELPPDEAADVALEEPPLLAPDEAALVALEDPPLLPAEDAGVVPLEDPELPDEAGDVALDVADILSSILSPSSPLVTLDTTKRVIRMKTTLTNLTLMIVLVPRRIMIIVFRQRPPGPLNNFVTLCPSSHSCSSSCSDVP